MRRLVILLLLVAPMWAQKVAIDGGSVVNGQMGSPAGPVVLPQAWVNSTEYIGTTARTITFPTSGSGGTCTGTCGSPVAPAIYVCGGNSYGPYTADSQSSVNTAISDAEACRLNDASHSGTTITLQAGHLYSGNAGLVLPQTAGDLITYTNFIILTSTSPLTLGQTVCSHGIQDNVAASTQPGIRNLGCNATAMSYQLGQTITTVPTGAFTLANGTATNTSAYNDIASMYTIQFTGTNLNALHSATWDANNVGPHHYAILNGEFRPQAGLIGVSAPILIGQSNTETLVSQLASHIHFAYDYVHGDYGDAPTSGGVATGPPTGFNSLPNGIALYGCTICSISYSYLDQMLRPGSEGHGIFLFETATEKEVHNWVEGASISHMCAGVISLVSIPNFTPCTDIEDRANRYTYPWSWLLSESAGYNPNSNMTTTSTGTGSGTVLELLTVQTGAIETFNVFSGGTGNAVGDILTAKQIGFVTTPPNNATFAITSVSGGVTTGAVIASGTGYTVANGLATTGGSGSGLTVNITSVAANNGQITGVTIGTACTTCTYKISDVITVVQSGGVGGAISPLSITGGGTPATIQTVTGTNYQSNGTARKNSHEYKASKRILNDGNIFENADYSGGQGTMISYKAQNANGISGGINGVYDGDIQIQATITNNILRNGCSGASMGDKGGPGLGDGGTVSLPATQYYYVNNLMYNMGLDNPKIDCFPLGFSQNYGLRDAASPNGTTWPATALRNAAGTQTTLTLTGSNATGNASSGFSVGDPVLVYGCTDTTFNTGAATNQLTLATPALPGTITQGLTVVYANTGTANAADNSGTCVLSNIQATPNYLFASHNSDFVVLHSSSVTADPVSDQSPKNTRPCILSTNFTFTNAITVGGGAEAISIGEGTVTTQCAFNPGTETYSYTAIPGRDTLVTCSGHAAGAGGIAACYTEYNNGTSTFPPVTLWGTDAAACAGNDPTTGACLGVLGNMSTGSFNYALSDWHNYRLCHATDGATCNSKASTYAAGGTHQASDGTDLGADFTKFDAAQTSNQYVCKSPCGPTGPYADH